MSKLAFAAAACGAVLLASGAAVAAEPFQPKAKGTIVINLRATVVAPQGKSPILTAAGDATGLNVEVGNDLKPTLGFSYFLTDKLAVELIAGTTQHTIRAVGGGDTLDISKQWVLPPTVTLQFHPLPAARVSPYVGAGVNYMLFYSRHVMNGVPVDLDNGFGGALQAGADVAIAGPWQLNLDAKKIFFRTDASAAGGALKSHVQLDPWVLSAGFGRRF